MRPVPSSVTARRRRILNTVGRLCTAPDGARHPDLIRRRAARLGQTPHRAESAVRRRR